MKFRIFLVVVFLALAAAIAFLPHNQKWLADMALLTVIVAYCGEHREKSKIAKAEAQSESYSAAVSFCTLCVLALLNGIGWSLFKGQYGGRLIWYAVLNLAILIIAYLICILARAEGERPRSKPRYVSH